PLRFDLDDRLRQRQQSEVDAIPRDPRAYANIDPAEVTTRYPRCASVGEHGRANPRSLLGAERNAIALLTLDGVPLLFRSLTLDGVPTFPRSTLRVLALLRSFPTLGRVLTFPRSFLTLDGVLTLLRPSLTLRGVPAFVHPAARLIGCTPLFVLTHPVGGSIRV